MSNQLHHAAAVLRRCRVRIGGMKNGRRIKRKRQRPGDQEPFGVRMARLRKVAGYTQRSLAEEIDVSHRMVAYYEGETERAPAHLLPEIARALGVTVDQLLGSAPVSLRKRPRNQRLMRKLLMVEHLSPRARRAVIDHIDALWSKEHGPSGRSERHTGNTKE